MGEVKIIKKSKPTKVRVLIRQRKSKRWNAWVADAPKLNAGGRTAMAAVGFLVRLNPEYFGIEVVGVEQFEEKRAGDEAGHISSESGSLE